MNGKEKNHNQKQSVLIFGGTTEGRELSLALCEHGILHVLSVATPYGEELASSGQDLVKIVTGRRNAGEMFALIEQERAGLVVDATHPYALEASEEIARAAKRAGVPLLRVVRDETADVSESGVTGDVCWYDTAEDCAKALRDLAGTILLTCGSKEVAVFAKQPDVRERLIARILPSEESIALCLQAGLKHTQLIAMQGPFSKELNVALLKEYDASHLVTKESGAAGGFSEKAEAAAHCGCRLHVIRRPKTESGISVEEVLRQILDYSAADAGCLLPEQEEHSGGRKEGARELVLAGAGMGDAICLTGAVKDAIQKADAVFGAKRVLEALAASDPLLLKGKERHPEYLATKVLEILRSEPEVMRSVVLFSGDSGFYSGAGTFLRDVKELSFSGTDAFRIRTEPGISSVSYLSAKTQVSYHDAAIVSLHGKKTPWEQELICAVKENETVFVLTSGREDVIQVAELLCEVDAASLKLVVGYNLSMDTENVYETDCSTPLSSLPDGSYTLLIRNPAPEPKALIPSLSDDAFVRGRVPMTKEEVRGICVAKLRLTAGSCLYDIGSGTGSVAVQAALLHPKIRVFAAEKKEEAVALIRSNCERFQVKNVTVLHGEAPDVLQELTPPTHVFIGGAGKRLRDILDLLSQTEHALRIVMTAVTLETVSELHMIPEAYGITDFEVLQVAVSKSKEAGAYHMMLAENPVYLCSFTLSGISKKQEEDF